MNTYLINGYSGSGKSTIGEELKNRGYTIIDTDKSFGYFGNIETEETVELPGFNASKEWYENNGWLWKRSLVEDAIDSVSKTTFFIGGSRNERYFYERFEKIFRLVADGDKLVERLKERGPNRLSNTKEFLKRARKFAETAESDGKKLGMVIIDTNNTTVEESCNQILNTISISD